MQIKIEVMKGRYNKSEIMKRAWKIFRGDSEWSGLFSESLKRAWQIVKENIRYAARQICEKAAMEGIKNIPARPSVNGSVSYSAAEAAILTGWYANAPKGTYFGD
ncbi:MAG: hypothetical protein LBV41_03020 [Cytophagaceae bacterium]|nr:hypothetical protein [Cytophagaceae bacterium]